MRFLYLNHANLRVLMKKNSTDLTKVRNARTKVVDPQQPERVRADVSQDGRVNATDMSRVRARRSNDARGIAEPVIGQ